MVLKPSVRLEHTPEVSRKKSASTCNMNILIISVTVLIPVPCHDKHLSSLPGEVLPDHVLTVCHEGENHDPLGVGVVLDLFHDMYLAHVHMVC
jgi:hypothetical protein